MDFNHTYADYVDEAGVKEIQALENETGNQMLAYYAPPEPADLPDEYLKRIQNLEKKLCIRLVAYKRHQ